MMDSSIQGVEAGGAGVVSVIASPSPKEYEGGLEGWGSF